MTWPLSWQVGDHQSLLLSLKESVYITKFESRVAVWEERLITLDAVLLLLNKVQRKWVYLEPIFGRGALPKYQPNFRTVDNDFTQLMAKVKQDARVVSLVRNIHSDAETALKSLQACQERDKREEKHTGRPLPPLPLPPARTPAHPPA